MTPQKTRNQMIRRLAANGVRQKDIAEKVGLSKQHVSDIVREYGNRTEPHKTNSQNLNQVSTEAELARLQAEIDNLLATKKESQTTVEYLRRKLAEKPQGKQVALNEAIA